MVGMKLYDMGVAELTLLPWRQRNELIETSLREYLAAVPRARTMSTAELARELCPGDPKYTGSVLTKLAPWMSSLATHDGEEFIAYGRKNRRWRWHGQA